jgi:short-subunit dehydrogenase
MESKVVVITGASAGIGAALAIQLGKLGHKPVLAARREVELKQVAAQVGDQAMTVICDVTSRGDIEKLRDSALAQFGRIDVWINNAGLGANSKVLELTDELFDQIINVNLKSAWYGMQAIVPYFQEQKKGHVINISSFLGKVPVVTFRSIYSASKAALNLLTANVRMDLAAEYPDVHVSLVMPGPVATEFAKNALGGTPSMPPMASPMQAQTPDEVAEVIVDVINNPRPEVFTHPDLYKRTVQYYTDVAGFEKMVREMRK